MKHLQNYYLCYVTGVNCDRHIGEKLVYRCMATAKEKGFKILQFNAVAKSNTTALNLYKKLGFIQLRVIPKGFIIKNGHYKDIIPHYITL